MASLTRTIRRKLKRQANVPMSAKAKAWLEKRKRKEWEELAKGGI